MAFPTSVSQIATEHTYTNAHILIYEKNYYYKINRKMLDNQKSQEHSLENFPSLIYDASLQSSKHFQILLSFDMKILLASL